MEDSKKQARKIEGVANEVNRVGVNSNEKGNPGVGGRQGTIRCFCCGNVGHKANDNFAPQEENGAQSQPLQVAGTFTADVLVENRALNEVEFVVIESEGHTLLGKTAIALGVLKLEPQINSLQFSPDRENREPSILDKFPGCCEGIGKLKDFQLKIPIDAEVQLVAQPIRRVPYHLRDK
ncbi:uncharacterized protein [Montipora foliosa]|uniref:uncharacterized protein n=1 Tax=Montipora foliosa TaxID=591990 RepID=UPI0035F1A074